MLQTRSAVSSSISEDPEVPPPPVPEPPVPPPQEGRHIAPPMPPPIAFAQSYHKNLDSTEMNATLATFPVQQVLRKHNIYRCMHGVPLLTWSSAGAAQAQAWVNHQQGVMVHGGHDGYGQNLAGLLPQWGYDEVRGVKMWYDEVANTNNGMVSGFGMNTGHYTQVVWRNTQQVGCASFVRSNCDNGNNPCLLACHYHPPGNVNYGSEFAANVNGPVRSEQQCESEVDGGSGGSSQCANLYPDCPGWAQAGFCASASVYHAFMVQNCCSSCR